MNRTQLHKICVVLLTTFLLTMLGACSQKEESGLDAIVTGSTNKILVSSLKYQGNSYWLYARNIDEQPLDGVSYCMGSYTECRNYPSKRIAGTANNKGDFKNDIYFSSVSPIDFSQALNQERPFIVTTRRKSDQKVISEYFTVKITNDDLVLAPVDQATIIINEPQPQNLRVDNTIEFYDDSEIFQGSATAQQLLVSLNNLRTRYKLPPLKLNQQLTTAAQTQANHLAQNFKGGSNPYVYLISLFNNVMYSYSQIHNIGGSPAQRVSKTGYTGSQTWRENYYWNVRSPEACIEGWHASPGHKVQLLASEVNEVGFGYARSPTTGETHWLANFGRR